MISVVDHEALFLLIRFHLDPFLLLRMQVFFLAIHTARFQTKTDIFQQVFTLAFSLLENKTSKACLLLAYSNSFVLSVQTVLIQLRFCQLIDLAPFLEWINVTAKPKTAD